jgi:2-amino-1-hydroxyethylphosphonate dioxygenase (glycine-forming)
MSNNPEAVVEEVIALLTRSGGDEYFGEAITKLSHAEQCAWCAAQAGADEELILASLLHDVGHLIESDQAIRDERIGVVNHDELGEMWLRERGFSARLAALVGGHVDAKRYLTATNPAYMQRLSPASKETLVLQGGPMDEASAAAFAAEPDLRDILRLRSWDEMAKDPAWEGPGIESYRPRLIAHLEAQSAGH